MKNLNLFFVVVLLALEGCNDHLGGDAGDNGNGTVTATVAVETLSSSRTALWAEMDSGNYDFALVRERTDSDPDLVGNKATLPGGLSALIVTGEDKLLIEADDIVEVWEIPTDKVGVFEQLVRNLWMLPAGWQPNLFPRSEGEASDLQTLLSAFICGRNLDLYSRGCSGQVPADLFRSVGETAYYEWSNHGHAKYVFVIVRGVSSP